MAPVIACGQCRRLTEERDRLRQALEEATRALAVDPRFLSPARLGTARSILAAALAGEGEACAKEPLPGECCRCYQTSDLPSCSDGREHCQHHSGGEAAEAQPTCTRCRMEPAYETLRICLGCSHVPGVVAPVDDDTLTATHLAAVQEERERCARIAETFPLAPDTHTGTRQRAMREGIAEAISEGRRHATKQNGDCADWCRACEDEARARAEKAREP